MNRVKDLEVLCAEVDSWEGKDYFGAAKQLDSDFIVRTVADLEAQVEELETLNEDLRDTVSSYKYASSCSRCENEERGLTLVETQLQNLESFFDSFCKSLHCSCEDVDLFQSKLTALRNAIQNIES